MNNGPIVYFSTLEDSYEDEIFCMQKHTDFVDISEFTKEEQLVIKRFIEKFPEYTAITGMYFLEN